jgi:hypothetical protein
MTIMMIWTFLDTIHVIKFQETPLYNDLGFQEK